MNLISKVFILQCEYIIRKGFFNEDIRYVEDNSYLIY